MMSFDGGLSRLCEFGFVISEETGAIRFPLLRGGLSWKSSTPFQKVHVDAVECLICVYFGLVGDLNEAASKLIQIEIMMIWSPSFLNDLC